MCEWLHSLMYMCLLHVYPLNANRGSRQDMAAMASPTGGVPPPADQNTTLMEDPDVWRP